MVLMAPSLRRCMLIVLLVLLTASNSGRLHVSAVRILGNLIRSGGSVLTGERLTNGRFALVMQGDCNLVLLDNSKPIWSTGTYGRGTACYAAMQTDGNLVIYNSGQRGAIWASNSVRGNNRYVLVLQEDRNVVIYTGIDRSGKPIWDTKTNLH